VSAKTGEGMEDLREALLESGFAGLRRADEPALVTRGRQTRALREAADEVDSFRRLLDEHHPAEIASAHLESAAVALDSVVGLADIDDVLGAIFATFCVGK
jgi:tRNA modification GTPase